MGWREGRRRCRGLSPSVCAPSWRSSRCWGRSLSSPALALAATGMLSVETPLQESPAHEAPLIALLPEGTVVSIDGPPVDGFYPVTAGDLSGWMRGETLSVEKDIVAEGMTQVLHRRQNRTDWSRSSRRPAVTRRRVETPATVDPAADPALYGGAARRNQDRTGCGRRRMTLPSTASRCGRFAGRSSGRPCTGERAHSSRVRSRRHGGARIDGRDDWRRDAGPRRPGDRDPSGRSRGARARSKPDAKPDTGARTRGTGERDGQRANSHRARP